MCTRAITRGVEVTTSSVYVPDVATVRGTPFFTYCLRLRLLSIADQEPLLRDGESPLPSVQVCGGQGEKGGGDSYL